MNEQVIPNINDEVEGDNYETVTRISPNKIQVKIGLSLFTIESQSPITVYHDTQR